MVTKLTLILTVMIVGGAVIGPALNTMLAARGDRTSRLIAAATYDVMALLAATVLSVFKPGRRFGKTS